MEKQLKVTEFSIPVPWGIIAGKAWGDEVNIPVLCVHGILDNCDSFSRLIPLLPKNFYYVCVDLPGHGRSSHFPKGLILDVMMYLFAVKIIVDHFKWTKIYYMGHSLGGILGLYLVCVFPENVEKLVSIDAFVTILEEDVLIFLKRRFREFSEREKRFDESKEPCYSLDEAVDRMVSSRFSYITEKEVKCFIERSLVKSDAGGYKFTSDQRLKLGLRPTLDMKQVENLFQNCKCPILVISATLKQRMKMLDTDKEEFFNTLFNTSTNITFSEIGEEHDVHLTRPDLLESIITKFFNRKCNL